MQQNENRPTITPQPFYPAAPLPYNPIYQERRSLQLWGNIIGFTILGFFAMQFFLGALLAVFHLYPLYNSSEITIQSFSILISVLCVFFPFFILMLATRKPDRDLLPLEKVKPTLFVPLVFIGMAVFILGNIATGALITVMDGFGVALKAPSSDKVTTVWGVLLYIISTAVIPALTEEFALRGVVLQNLRKYGDSFAVVISALLFAVMHGNFVQAPFAFIGGLALGWMAVKTGSLWVGIAIHFLNNLMAVLFDVFKPALGEELYTLVNYGVFFLLLCAGILSLIVLLKKQPDLFQLDNPASLCTFKQKISAFLCTPGIIVTFIVIALLSTQFLEVRWLNV